MNQKHPEITHILEAVQELDNQTKRFLLQQIQTMIMKESSTEAWTDEELRELIDPQPLSGAEIIAAGLTGTWADEDIVDGAAWVNLQKAKRQHKYPW